jgi:pyruvate,water dikinase
VGDLSVAGPGAGTSSLAAPRPLVVDLVDEAARDPELVGGKAAALARATDAGLPVLPGVVLTTAFSDAVDAGAGVHDHPAVREAFVRAAGAEQPLVARSSSIAEDLAESSMAGRYESVVDIRGLDAFAQAVEQVLGSRVAAQTEGTPIAVLVQPMLEPVCGGVLFGIDPVTGRSDRLVVGAVHGGPQRLVSGEVEGTRYVLDTAGDVVASEQRDGPELAADDLRRLAGLAADVATIFGWPQDAEWAFETGGDLRLLQSRPVTTEIRGVPSGPVYGPGPVAETFPEPLTELERDLWVPPLQEAVREAAVLAGSATRDELERSELVVSVDGHVAIDLHVAGAIDPRRGFARKLNPIRALRQARVAWRVGRLRAAMPRLSEHLLDRADLDLERIPSLDELTSRQLIALIHRSQAVLRSLHAHEILMGMLTDTGGNQMTGASVALRVLAEARRDGLSDDEILDRSPVVLALAPPRVAPKPSLPPGVSALDLAPAGDGGNPNGILREALRLRVRWVHELTGRAAWELGERLTRAGQLPEPGLVRHMSLDHVEAVATKRAVVVPALVAAHEHVFGSPLPAWFRLSNLGKAIPEQFDSGVGGGTGAGGGRGCGPVTRDVHDPPPGSVLVTTTMTPGLAPLLPRLRGIVAETGSVLSHLAILAREANVPTVVGYHGATANLPEGTTVCVDGATGHVTIEGKEAPG